MTKTIWCGVYNSTQHGASALSAPSIRHTGAHHCYERSWYGLNVTDELTIYAIYSLHAAYSGQTVSIWLACKVK